MKNLLLFIAIPLLLTGCFEEEEDPDEIMKISHLYTLNKEDKIINTPDVNASNTLLKIRHVDGQEISVVELLEGNATIVRK